MAGQWNTPAGWYPDPRDPRWLRYWDGAEWTDHTQPIFPVPPGPNASVVQGSASRAGARSWWQTWWAIVPGLVFCLPIGLIGLWFRRGTSNGVKAAVSVVTVALFVIALATDSSDESDTTSTSATTESASPSATVTPTVTSASVPALEGLSEGRAEQKLRAAGLEPGRITHKSTSVRVGTVLAQGLTAGTSVDVGTKVGLIISVPLPKIPLVIGQSAASAKAELLRGGYGVKTLYRTRTSGREGAVLSQSPRSGTSARRGSLVTLTVLKVVAPPPPPQVQPTNCTPGYSPCLPPASDYDCAGGSGDGPKYAVGPVQISGYDPYDLDADGDGIACEY